MESADLSHKAFERSRLELGEIGEKWSFTKIINRSIVQGSGTGPMLFIICITDLKPIDSTNYITKYVDDSSLLIPDIYDVDLSEELRSVLKWVEHNKMQVNMAKTKRNSVLQDICQKCIISVSIAWH